MPSLVFDTDEIEADSKGIVNKSGYLYVGRKYTGQEVTWVKLKNKDI